MSDVSDTHEEQLAQHEKRMDQNEKRLSEIEIKSEKRLSEIEDKLSFIKEDVLSLQAVKRLGASAPDATGHELIEVIEKHKSKFSVFAKASTSTSIERELSKRGPACLSLTLNQLTCSMGIKNNPILRQSSNNELLALLLVSFIGFFLVVCLIHKEFKTLVDS